MEYGVRRSWSQPGDSVRPLDLYSLTTSGRIAVAHPFIRSRTETLRAGLSFTIRDSRTDALGDKLSQDRLRIVAANVSYDFADGWGGSNLLTAELSKGLDILNATESGSANLSRSGGRSDFRKLLVSAQRNQPLTDSLVLALSGEAQYSPDQLLTSEEYGLGGKQYGRAFDPSEITGDSGFAGRAELQYILPVQEEGLDYAVAYGFGDYGAVYNYEGGTRHGRRSLASTGVGLRFGVFRRIDASVELAKPFITTPLSTLDRAPRAFFTLSTRF